MKRIILIYALSISLALPALAYEATTTNDNTTSSARSIKREIENEKKAARERITDLRAEYKSGAKAFAETFKNISREEKKEFRAKRDDARTELKQRKEEFKGSLEQARLSLKETLQRKREKLKQELAKVKNEIKANRIEKIDAQLEKLNIRLTDHFVNILDRLDKILDNIASRAQKAEAHGRDITDVTAAIESAQTKVGSARGAVLTQAEKIYSISIGSDDSIKIDVGAARKLLHGDLTTARNIVKSAREAVHLTATTLAKIPNVDEMEVENEDNEDSANGN